MKRRDQAILWFSVGQMAMMLALSELDKAHFAERRKEVAAASESAYRRGYGAGFYDSTRHREPAFKEVPSDD